MKQEEIWMNHVRNTKVEDIVRQYNHPAIFQQELIAVINKAYEEESKVIEVGCELGVTTLLLCDKFDKTLLDLNPLAIELTKKAHKALDKQANFIIADMFSMPIENKEFNILFNAGVIEHFSKEERKRAFKEYSRILKDDGVMFIAFPNHYSLPYRLAYKIRKLLNKWIYPDEYKIYNLEEEIESNNLVLEERLTLSKKSLMGWLNFLPPLKWLFQLIDKVYTFEGYLTVLVVRKKV